MPERLWRTGLAVRPGRITRLFRLAACPGAPLRQLLDDLEEFRAVVAALATELDEFERLGE